MIKKKKALKLRHELKHIINPSDDIILASRLRKIFRHDANADSHGSYRVSSCYFDTAYDKALRQKIDGVNHREKFRIRYYNDDTSFIRLEKKMKISGLCAKHSARVTKEEAESILSGDIEFLLTSKSPLLLEFYSKMKGQLLAPKTIVTYDREAFVYEPGNVRITIDRNLRVGNLGAASLPLQSGNSDSKDSELYSRELRKADFLNPQLLHLPVSDGLSVLEVKYDEFLPDIVRMAAQIPNRQASAYSKYAICRRYN